MKLILGIILVSILCINSSDGENLEMGNSLNATLVFKEEVNLAAVPLKIRTKNVFYNDEKNRIIKGISAIDNDRGQARATVTAGGVGFASANIKIKSERGKGLNYQVQIFA